MPIPCPTSHGSSETVSGNSDVSCCCGWSGLILPIVPIPNSAGTMVKGVFSHLARHWVVADGGHVYLYRRKFSIILGGGGFEGCNYHGVIMVMQI